MYLLKAFLWSPEKPFELWQNQWEQMGCEPFQVHDFISMACDFLSDASYSSQSYAILEQFSCLLTKYHPS